MTISASPRRITARGFWLPIGRANFFRHKDDSSLLKPELLEKGQNLDAIRTDDSSQNPKRDLTNWLQVSVYRRLVSVLPDMGYTTVIPLYPPSRREYQDD
jgi:hypothetical protein